MFLICFYFLSFFIPIVTSQPRLVHYDRFQSFETALCEDKLIVRPDMLEKVAPVLVRCVPFSVKGWSGLLKRLNSAPVEKTTDQERKKLITIVKKRIAKKKKKKKDYIQTKKDTEAGVKEDDADAQFDLGSMYNEGAGVPKSHEKAIAAWKLAGKKGHVTALYNLGNKYCRGEGCVQSFKSAIEYWQLAGSGDDITGPGAEAIANIGVMYRDGSGVTQSYKKAAKYFAQAGEHGNGRGQYCLGAMYLDGSLPKNLRKARKWFEKVEQTGHNYQQGLYQMAIQALRDLDIREGKHPLVREGELPKTDCSFCGRDLLQDMICKICGDCGAKYCDEECRKNHLKDHKEECKKIFKNNKKENKPCWDLD